MFKNHQSIRECGDASALHAHAVSQRALCEAQKGSAKVYENGWLMAIGLGNSHPLENGMLWHPTLGVPYFQGSTVKGMAKALMEKWGAKPSLIKPWFGSVNLLTSPNMDNSAKLSEAFKQTFDYGLDDELKQQLETDATGVFIFLDAIPIEPVMLKQSLVTPHYGKWYEKGDSQPMDTDVQPGDWQSPVPVSFLAVEKAVMQFAVMPRLGANVKEGEIEQISNIITLALEHLGIGAKTATGYGRMQVANKQEAQIKKAVEQLADEQIVINKFLQHLENLQVKWKGRPSTDCGLNDFYNQVMAWEDKAFLQQGYEVVVEQGKLWRGENLSRNKRWAEKLNALQEKIQDK